VTLTVNSVTCPCSLRTLRHVNVNSFIIIIITIIIRSVRLFSGDLFIVVYSVDSRESFDEAGRLQDQVFLAKGGQSTAGGRSRTPYVPHVIVGNKTDRDTERVVETSELKALVDRYPNCCGGVETSARRNQNVDEV